MVPTIISSNIKWSKDGSITCSIATYSVEIHQFIRSELLLLNHCWAEEEQEQGNMEEEEEGRVGDGIQGVPINEEKKKESS